MQKNCTWRHMSTDKVIVHIDLNAFFVQCEEINDPSLIGKRVAVGHNGKRSVISTANYEARKLGVHSSLPVSQAFILIPDLVLVEPKFDLYLKKSNEFFSIIKSMFSKVEMASIDECYIDMTKEIDGKDIHDYLFDLQLMLYKKTSLKCSIGCSFTTFLAKMASDYKKPLGLTILTRENYKDIIYTLPISDMYSIGKKTAPKLEEMSIYKIGDILKADQKILEKRLGKQYRFIIDALTGNSSDEVEIDSTSRKSISSERTFENSLEDYDDIRNCISMVSSEVGQSLSKYNRSAKTILVKLRDDNFKTISHRETLKEYVSSYEQIYLNAMKIFDKIYKKQPLRLLGVGVENLKDNTIHDKIKDNDVQEFIIDSLDEDL